MAEQHSSLEKPSISQMEDVEGGKASRDIMHGDRALALIGDQHIALTEDDVSSTSLRNIAAMVLTTAPFTEQAYSSQD
jgi:hypothetical protein